MSEKEDVMKSPQQVLCERFAHYYQHLFHGKTREMARFLGVSHSVVSKVRRGLQGPGEQLLEALGEHPQANVGWLRTGEGEAILPSTVGSLPVVTAILPGPPSTCREMLGGERHPVVPDNERITRYWLRMGICIPSLWVIPNDILLVETAADHLHRLDLIDRRLCAVALESGMAARYQLALIVIERDKLFADLLLTDSPASSQKDQELFMSRGGRRYYLTKPEGRRAQAREADEMNQTSTEPEAGSRLVELSLDQVVGLVIRLERPDISISDWAEKTRGPW